MGQATGQILVYAVGIAISPVPIIGVVLMLGTPRARSTGPAFLLGWVAGLAAAGTTALLVADGADASEAGSPAEWVSLLKLGLGVLLLVAAWRQWRGRPRRDEEPEMPSWMRRADSFTAPRAIGLGVALAVFNPKNLLLLLGAVAAISQTGASTAAQAGALAVFVLIATIGAGAPVVLYFALGEGAAGPLEGLRRWMSLHGAAIMVVLCLLIGAKLIGDAVSGLAT